MPNLGWRSEVLLHLHASNRGRGWCPPTASLNLQRNYVGKVSLSERDRIADAVQLIARLGGCHARKHGPAPGIEVNWHGQMWLGITEMFMKYCVGTTLSYLAADTISNLVPRPESSTSLMTSSKVAELAAG